MFGHVKLGLRPAVRDKRTLKLAKYVNLKQLPEPPAGPVDWSAKVDQWPLYRNDEFGCCGPVSTAHAIICQSSNDGAPVVPTEDQVLATYRDVGNWNQAQPETDNGVVLLELMRYWRNHGIAGHRIDAFASLVDNSGRLCSKALFRTGLWLFGGLILGLRLPAAAQDQPWKNPGQLRPRQRRAWAKDSWGGHAVYLPREGGPATWAHLVDWDWWFANQYISEAFVVVNRQWLGDDNRSPSGFDGQQMLEDLQAITA